MQSHLSLPNLTQPGIMTSLLTQSDLTLPNLTKPGVTTYLRTQSDLTLPNLTERRLTTSLWTHVPQYRNVLFNTTLCQPQRIVMKN